MRHGIPCHPQHRVRNRKRRQRQRSRSLTKHGPLYNTNTNRSGYNAIHNSQRRSPTSAITSSEEETTHNEDNDEEEEAAHFSPRSTSTTTFNLPRNRKPILPSSDFNRRLCELENNNHKITVNDIPFQQQQKLVEVPTTNKRRYSLGTIKNHNNHFHLRSLSHHSFSIIQAP
ncbi:unnamed protein product [Didymodactylos carnosus]|uniref:Uncharacterized protein n=1 Tax=Didymodactylos carnosus TaxID=1234261 RepID=A0A8S2R5Z5_9BILA|nr:unnamed protein product [Didymodactylos carnosus]CAF4141578.1 unnamed protein product [Didymodactylos carnosus]